MTKNKVWTVEEILARRSEGDALVTADGWSFGTITGCHPTDWCAVRLSCWRPEPHTARCLERDARDGEFFASHVEAEAYGLNAGRLRWYSDARAGL